MAKVKPDDWDKIEAQVATEIEFARNYKQGKVSSSWQANEELYYSRPNALAAKNADGTLAPINSAARANVDLGLMASFVHTILSKIDEPLAFKFLKRKSAQARRVDQLNALRLSDQNKNDWEIKDIVGKKQVLIYGRTVFSYYAESLNGYEAHLDNIDVYDYLIDPSAGGIDIERAKYMGDFGVVKSRKQLEDGVKKKIYDKDKTKEILDGSGNVTESNREETNKKKRRRDQGTSNSDTEISDKDKFKFWRWGTTYEGDRYYVLYSEKGGTALEITPIEEKFESGLWWYWTYAAFPDLTEFWTPSYCDYVRQVFMAQSTSINQMLDLHEQTVKPTRVVQVGAIENLAELKYRRDAIVKVKANIDINKAYQTVATPSISTPITVYNLLDAIQQKASGVTAGDQGDAPNNENTKVTIYKGNQANSADRFGLLNKSYSFGYKRFAKLYELGVKEHLIKKVAVDILGPEGVEVEQVNRRDIFRKNEDFNVMVEASKAEEALSESNTQVKIGFLSAQGLITGPDGRPVQNAKKAYEIQAKLARFTDEEIRQLLDTSTFGDEQIMSMADEDIERLLEGEKFDPNQAANTAYKQRFVDYMQKNQELIDDDQFKTLAEYVMKLDPIIIRNMTRQANDMLMKMNIGAAAAAMNPNAKPVAGQPVPPTVSEPAAV